MGGNLIPMNVAQGTVRMMMPFVATVTAPTRTPDGRGGELITYDPAQARQLDVMITVAKAAAYKKFGESVKPGTLYTARFPFGAAIDNQSLVVIDGRQYELAPPTPDSSYDVTDTMYLIAVQ